MAAHSPPLNMACVYILISKQLGIHIVLESIHFCDSYNSFDSIRRMHCHILALHLVFISLIQCYHFISCAVTCSKDVSSTMCLCNCNFGMYSLVFLCIVTSFLFRDVFVMYLSHVIPRFSYREVSIM